VGRIRAPEFVVPAAGDRSGDGDRAIRRIAGVIAVDADTAHGLASTLRRAVRESLPCVVVTRHPRELVEAERQLSVLFDDALQSERREVEDGPPPAWLQVIGCDDLTSGLGEAFRGLGALGVGPGLVVVAGAPDLDVRAAGGERALVVSLEDLDGVLEARRRARALGRVPGIDEDPRWVVVFEAVPDTRDEMAVVESMTTLANGDIGTRGVYEDDGEGTPMVASPGVFDDRGDSPTLLAGPDWTSLVMRPSPGARDRRLLDLRTGVLLRERTTADEHARSGNRRSPLRTLRFVPLERGPCGILLAEGPASEVAPGLTLHLPGAPPLSAEGDDERGRYAVVGHEHGGIVAFGDTAERRDEGVRTLERVVGFAVDGDELPSVEQARDAHSALRRDGVDAVLAEHRAAWARRWEDAEVSIEGDPQLERAVRFALFHLLSSVREGDEAAVGPRGLSGVAYGGHVLWDADVYVLPAMAAIFPGGARAMVEYRVRRLDEARRIAARLGSRGARFPWESGRDGRDVTPRLVRRSGQIIPILTGWREEHVVADVAWAVSHYVDWTGDDAFLDGPGGELVLECARYWAARIRVDRHGVAHVFGVVGPDEYHEVVDDNAYTNVMARWNLRRAAEIARQRGTATADEIESWLALAAALVDGYDERSGTHEQFTGYRRLDHAPAALLPGSPVMADELLGRLRVKGSQIVKQPDVLMLHHLVPDDLARGSLRRDLDYYGPLTAHGSSLSPPIHAALLARAGLVDAATEMLSLAARLDLDDITHTTGRGLHLATMGGVWQALAYGFMGLRPRSGTLVVDPSVPDSWGTLSLNVRFRGARVRLEATSQMLRVTGDRPVTVEVPGHGSFTVEPSATEIALATIGRGM
jgi:trehalose/maltose hydrolase-like predicted phosphorylase